MLMQETHFFKLRLVILFVNEIKRKYFQRLLSEYVFRIKTKLIIFA